MKKLILLFVYSISIITLLSSCFPFNQTGKVREGEYLTDLFTPKYDNTLGKKDAETVIIVFSDYNCSYCREFNITIKNVLKECRDLKVIFIDYPKLGSISTFAAKAAIAAAEQGKYIEAHDALLNSKEKYKDDFTVLQVLEKAGVDIKALELDIQSVKVDRLLLQNLLEGGNQSIKYVPTVIVGNVNNTGKSTILVLPSKSKLERVIRNYSDNH